MNGFEALLDFIRHNLLQSLFFGVIAVSVLRRIVKQASEDQTRRGVRGPLPPTAPDDDLREQVRRGFEEMMRQRAAAANARTAAKVPPKPTRTATSKKAPSAAPRPTPLPPRVPLTAPKMTPVTAPAAPVDIVRAAAATVARSASLARERLAGRSLTVTQPSIARRLLQDRSSVRRAFLLREILDVPRSLRTGS